MKLNKITKVKKGISIKVDGKTYKGEVEIKEEGNITVLSEM